MEIQTTKIFKWTNNSDKRIIVHQGGTRSSKTYNIVIWWIIKLMQEQNKTLTICRQTMPSIKKTVFRDFQEIMRNMKLWNDKNMSYSNMYYKLGTNLIEFMNLDDDQKIRGAKRDYLYINEANEVSLAIFKQLIFRTSKKIILDYNPSDEFHWIYDEVITRDDCDFFRSTYKDNPFLSVEQIKEIERLKDLDPNYWRIYGLGERGVSETSIFKNWQLCDSVPETDVIYYGLDFGYNHPTSLIKLTLREEEAYSEELIYKSHLTGADIISHLKDLNISKSATIIADSARPELIQEINGAGFNIIPTKKGAGSVKAGIDMMKRHKLFISKESVNLIKEIKSYKWKVDKDERVLDEPVKVNDHALDALRYAFEHKLNQDTYGDIVSISL